MIYCPFLFSYDVTGRCKFGILSDGGHNPIKKGHQMDRGYCGGHLPGLVCGLWVRCPDQDRRTVHGASAFRGGWVGACVSFVDVTFAGIQAACALRGA